MAGKTSIENGLKGGRPVGSKNKQTLEKSRIERAIKGRIMRSADALINSQMGLAKGLTYLYVIKTNRWKDKDGKWKSKRQKPRLVKDQPTIEAYLADELTGDDDYYFLSTDKPDNKALDSLMDRAFGKAQRSMDITSGGDPIPIYGGLSISKYKGNGKDIQSEKEDPGSSGRD